MTKQRECCYRDGVVSSMNQIDNGVGSCISEMFDVPKQNLISCDYFSGTVSGYLIPNEVRNWDRARASMSLLTSLEAERKSSQVIPVHQL